MVRKSCRTYAAIEAGFQALETREAKLRLYYQPLSFKASELLQTEGRMTTTKHRYADQLDWADDISTLTSIDDPICMENLRRKHARAASAYAASRASQKPSQPQDRVSPLRRPTSAPARQGFGGSGNSALQTALRGALEAVQHPSLSVSQGHSFESRLIDEYLKSNSLLASAMETPNTSECATIVPKPGQTQATESQLPLIHECEEVEDVNADEGMEGEESILSPEAMLLYYGHTKPRQRRCSSGSPRPSSSQGRRSLSPAGCVPNGSEACSARVKSPGRAISPGRIQIQIPVRARSGSPARGNIIPSHVRPQSALPLDRPKSASCPLSIPQSSVEKSLSTSRGMFLQSMESKNGIFETAVEPKITLRPRPFSSRAYYPSVKQEESAPGPITSSISSVVLPTCGVMSGLSPTQKLRESSSDASDHNYIVSSDPLQLDGSLNSRHRGKGPSNGVVLRDPTGFSITTKKAQRPMSARPATVSGCVEDYCSASKSAVARQRPSSASPMATSLASNTCPQRCPVDVTTLSPRSTERPSVEDMEGNAYRDVLQDKTALNLTLQARPPRNPIISNGSVSSLRSQSGSIHHHMGSVMEGASLQPLISDGALETAIRSGSPPALSGIGAIPRQLRMLELARLASIGSTSTMSRSSNQHGIVASDY